MASFKILVKRSAEKELRRIPPSILSKVVDAIQKLSHQPRPSGIQMLKGGGRLFRLRQGDYRVIYEVDDARQEVTVVKVGHRREVYER